MDITGTSSIDDVMAQCAIGRKLKRVPDSRLQRAYLAAAEAKKEKEVEMGLGEMDVSAGTSRKRGADAMRDDIETAGRARDGGSGHPKRALEKEGEKEEPAKRVRDGAGEPDGDDAGGMEVDGCQPDSEGLSGARSTSGATAAAANS